MSNLPLGKMLEKTVYMHLQGHTESGKQEILPFFTDAKIDKSEMYVKKPYSVDRRFNSRGGINVPMKTFDSLG